MIKNFVFKPRLLECLKNYNKELFMKDLMAGIIVGIVALPLAIAFGIVCACLFKGSKDSRSNKILCKPGIVSRGFVYLKDSQNLIKEAESIVYDALKAAMKQKVTFGDLKNCVRNTLEPFLYQKTNHNPIVIPVILNHVEAMKKSA